MGNSGQTNLKILWAAEKEKNPKVRNQPHCPDLFVTGLRRGERNQIKLGGLLAAFGRSFCLTWKPQPWQTLRGAFQMIALAMAPGVQGRQLTITPFVFFFMFDSQMPFWSAVCSCLCARVCIRVYLCIISDLSLWQSRKWLIWAFKQIRGWFTHYSIKWRGFLLALVMPCSITEHDLSCGTVKL